MGPRKSEKSHLRILGPTLGAQGAEKGGPKNDPKNGPSKKTKKWTLRAPTGQILTPPGGMGGGRQGR